MTTSVMPAAMTGPVRRVADGRPRYRIEVRACNGGDEVTTRSFPHVDRETAMKDFDHQVRLNRRAYATGRTRLVLIDTEGR